MQTANQTTDQPKTTTSFRLKQATLDKLRLRLPNKGERNYVLEELVQMFLRGDIRLKSRTL